MCLICVCVKVWAVSSAYCCAAAAACLCSLCMTHKGRLTSHKQAKKKHVWTHNQKRRGIVGCSPQMGRGWNRSHL